MDSLYNITVKNAHNLLILSIQLSVIQVTVKVSTNKLTD